MRERRTAHERKQLLDIERLAEETVRAASDAILLQLNRGAEGLHQARRERFPKQAARHRATAFARALYDARASA